MTQGLFRWILFALLTAFSVLVTLFATWTDSEAWFTVWVILAVISWTFVASWALIALVIACVEFHDRLPR